MLWTNTDNIQTGAVRDAKLKKKKVNYLKFARWYLHTNME